MSMLITDGEALHQLVQSYAALAPVLPMSGSVATAIAVSVAGLLAGTAAELGDSAASAASIIERVGFPAFAFLVVIGLLYYFLQAYRVDRAQSLRALESLVTQLQEQSTEQSRKYETLLRQHSAQMTHIKLLMERCSAFDDKD